MVSVTGGNPPQPHNLPQHKFQQAGNWLNHPGPRKALIFPAAQEAALKTPPVSHGDIGVAG
jgi:hypothetical protein